MRADDNAIAMATPSIALAPKPTSAAVAVLPSERRSDGAESIAAVHTRDGLGIRNGDTFARFRYHSAANVNTTNTSAGGRTILAHRRIMPRPPRAPARRRGSATRARTRSFRGSRAYARS